MIRPIYVHAPTCYVYEYPVVTNVPLGTYTMANGIVNLFGNQLYNTAMPLETMYASAAMAMQPGKFPATLTVPNEIAYPAPYYSVAEYNNPYAFWYGGLGGYGQRGFYPARV